MKFSTLAVITLVASLCVASAACHADDTYMNGESGAIYPMRNCPSIRMVSELVRIKLPEGSVNARFVFHNSGPAADVTVGFPENGMTDMNGHVPYTTMKNFRSWVGGKPVRVERIGPRMVDDDADFRYSAWWTKRVHFAAGQTLAVRDTYTGGLYHLDADGGGIVGFYYILKTGSSWHGTIGDAKIVCDVSGLRDCGPVYFQPPGGHRNGNTIEWNIRNFKPNRDVILGWVPDFEAVSVNGQPVWHYTNATKNGEDVFDPSNDIDPEMFAGGDSLLGDELPQRIGSDVWLPTLVASNWMGAHSTFDGRHIYIHRGRRTAIITAGSSVLQSGYGAHVSMRRRAALFETQQIQTSDDINAQTVQVESTYVFLRPLVKSLGGSSHWDRRDNRLVVWLPRIR